jgi:hypothetical protein
VSGIFLPFKGMSHSLSSQAALFFSFAKGEKKPFAKESRSDDTGQYVTADFAYSKCEVVLKYK